MEIKGKPFLSVKIIPNRKSIKGLKYSTLAQSHFCEDFDKIIEKNKVNISRAEIVLFE